MRSALILLIVVSVTAAAAETFFSKKIENVQMPPPVTASNIYQGSFFTRRDHTRPQQRDLALLVCNSTRIYRTTTKWITENI